MQFGTSSHQNPKPKHKKQPFMNKNEIKERISNGEKFEDIIEEEIETALINELVSNIDEEIRRGLTGEGGEDVKIEGSWKKLFGLND
jgi:hypothetical protein